MNFRLLALIAVLASPLEVIANTSYRWKTDEMSDKRILTITLTDETNKKGRLVFSCYPTNPKKRNLYGALDVAHVINPSTVNANSKYTWVTLRFDQDKSRKEILDIDINDNRRFLLRQRKDGSNKEVKKFINASLSKDKMLFRYQSWIKGEHTLSFNVNELRPLIKKAESEGCNWNR